MITLLYLIMVAITSWGLDAKALIVCVVIDVILSS